MEFFTHLFQVFPNNLGISNLQIHSKIPVFSNYLRIYLFVLTLRIRVLPNHLGMQCALFEIQHRNKPEIEVNILSLYAITRYQFCRKL